MPQIHQNTTLEIEAKTSCLFVLQAGNNTHFHTSALIIPCFSLACHFELWELR